MNKDSSLSNSFLKWLKRWWLAITAAFALLTFMYNFGSNRAAFHANRIASLSNSAKIVPIASDSFHGVGFNVQYLQQVLTRRFVIRLANVGSVPTSLTSVEFNGHIKSLRRSRLPRQNVAFSYGKPDWEPFLGYAVFVWRDKPPPLNLVTIASIQTAPWTLDNKSSVKQGTSFDADAVQERLEKSEVKPKEQHKPSSSERTEQQYAISGINLPIMIPANSTIDITIDIIIRSRMVINDIFSAATRVVSAVDRGLNGKLTLEFPDADSLQLVIDEDNEIARIQMNYPIYKDISDFQMALEYGLVENPTTIAYKVIPKR